jgi:hypothetical protein
MAKARPENDLHPHPSDCRNLQKKGFARVGLFMVMDENSLGRGKFDILIFSIPAADN